MKSSELRQKFLKFFEKNGHKIIPSASLIPENDSSTLFIGSGMQPLIPYLLGEPHPQGVRLCNSQKSFRVEDIEEIGDGRHNTFFEMMGNWSLGDYFKKEQLNWIYSFLIDEIGLSPNNIYASVFIGDEAIGVPKDTESADILKEIFEKRGISAKEIIFSEEVGMRDGRIFYYPAKKNWWSKSGVPEKMPIGEIGGPDSEIFYDLGIKLKKHENSYWSDQECHINCDCGRFIEIGNSVFIEYKKTNKGFEKLEQRNVDFGGGFERLAMVSQGLDNIFKTDLFLNIINKIEELSGKKYEANKKSFEIIADHLKAAVFIMGDERKIVPNNVGQGYIARRLIRRAVRFGKQLEISQKNWMTNISEIIINDYKNVYLELKKNSDFITKELVKEEERFEKTLNRGLKVIEKMATINGKEAFLLYETYGFPLEVLEEIRQVDSREDFFEELKKHQELSRTASAGMFKGGLADDKPETIKLHTAHHLLLAALQEVFGKNVKQRGSNINSQRLRLDFSIDRKLTDEEKNKIEDIVNRKIKEDLDIIKREMPIEEAKKIGAEMEFGVKYGNTVSVYFIEDKEGNVFSKEFCGGPHVKKTSELGKFEIIKEEASSQGVRRIKAVIK